MKTNVHFYIISMTSYLWFSRWSAYIFNYINTLYCTCTKWLYSINTRFHSLSNDWPASPVFTSSRPVGRSVMLPEVVGYGPCVSVPSPGEDTWENNTIKRPLQYVRWLKTLKLAGSILTHIHIPSPHWRQRHQSHSDAVEITPRIL